jgi:hypothetical protein
MDWISRRSLLLTPLALAAQSRPASVLVLWSGLRSVPESLARVEPSDFLRASRSE